MSTKFGTIPFQNSIVLFCIQNKRRSSTPACSLPIYNFLHHDLVRSVSDAVHLSHPRHRVIGFQGLYINYTFPQYGVRYIAINDHFDTIDPNSTDSDMAGIKNWFNEWYSKDTSRKIRAVNKAKGERGERLTTNVPYGYKRDPDDPKKWVIDEEAAQVVKRIFALCMEGKGPSQIAALLEKEKVLNPTAYKQREGRKTPHQTPENEYRWHESTVAYILEYMEYTGCTVNFKTYTNSIWDKKQRESPMENRKIFYNTHPAIISLEVFDKVQEIRQQRHR